MVYIPKVAGAVAAIWLTGSISAHPGEHHDHQAIKREIRYRDQMASAAKRSIDGCSNSLKARELSARSAARRAEVARDLRQKRNIKSSKSKLRLTSPGTDKLSKEPKKFRRDLAILETYEAIDHNATTLHNYITATPETTIFSANTSCILTPEVTDGPYYVTGESIRKNVVEDQTGVSLYLEVQYLDINTCEPVEGIWVDIWNANSTGVYRYFPFSPPANQIQ
jgi:hypothetical protein